MSEVSNVEPAVTFVGGKAVEQTEQVESTTDPDVREDAMEAVRKAIKEAGESAAKEAESYKSPLAKAAAKEKETPERGSDGKFLPKDGKSSPKQSEDDSEPVETASEKFDPETASVKQLLKAREQVAGMKREAKDEVSKAKAEIEAARQQLAQQQQQQQQAWNQIQRELNNLKRLKSNPAQAVREAGWDPEQFIIDLANDGTPEGKSQRELRELRNQIAEMQTWKAQQAKLLEEQQYNYHVEQARTARRNAVDSFTKLAMDGEKFPHVAAFYKGRDRALVAEGDIIAEEYRNLSNGKEGTFEQILEFIEDELADRMKGWYTTKSGSQQDDTKPQPKKKVEKGKALSPDGSGERRALKPKDLTDLDADERREAAKQAVAVALAASKSDD